MTGKSQTTLLGSMPKAARERGRNRRQGEVHAQERESEQCQPLHRALADVPGKRRAAGRKIHRAKSVSRWPSRRAGQGT
jgi:hypothetical protein